MRNIAKATTAAMCRPLTDSRWVRPLRRIASASSWSTAFWSPVASAMAIPAGLRGKSRGDMVAGGRSRARSRPCGCGRAQDGHRTQRLADRADALEPGVAREIVGAREAPSAAAAQAGRGAGSRAPGAIPAGNLSSSIETRTRGGSARRAGASSQPDRLPAPRDNRRCRPGREHP